MTARPKKAKDSSVTPPQQQTIRFADVNRSAYNPRISLTPDDPEWRDIKASLDEFGQVLPLVVNRRNMVLISGHQRMSIMQHDGKQEASFTVVDLDDGAEKRLNIILNKTGGRWDRRGLENLLTEMRDNRLDLTRLGFNPVELKTIFNSAKPPPKSDPDATAPNPPTIPYSKVGDLYELWTGDTRDTVHRIMCGDSTEPETWKKLMQGELGKLVFHDPPYGIDYNSEKRKGGKIYEFGKVINDNLKSAGLSTFLQDVFDRCNENTDIQCAHYCFHADQKRIEFETAMAQSGWRVKQQLLWIKPSAFDRADYHWQHEPILYACKTADNSIWYGDRTQTTAFLDTEPDWNEITKENALEILKELAANTTVWREKRDAANSLVHPTQKSIKLAQKAMRNSSQPGDIVLDPFAGSHSTLIAAEIEGRRCYTIELEPGYTDAGIQRFFETFQDPHATKNGKPHQPKGLRA